MLQTILHYMRCFIPVGWIVLCGLAWVLTTRIISAIIIARPLPVNGFASVEEEIRFVNDEPAVMRRHMRYKANLIFLLVIAVTSPLMYLIPALIWK